jgi:hypothetical protein
MTCVCCAYDRGILDEHDFIALLVRGQQREYRETLLDIRPRNTNHEQGTYEQMITQAQRIQNFALWLLRQPDKRLARKQLRDWKARKKQQKGTA